MDLGKRRVMLELSGCSPRKTRKTADLPGWHRYQIVFWRPTRFSGNGVEELNVDRDGNVSVGAVLTVDEVNWSDLGYRRRPALRSGVWRGKAGNGRYAGCRGYLFAGVRWCIDATVQCSTVGAQPPNQRHGELPRRCDPWAS